MNGRDSTAVTSAALDSWAPSRTPWSSIDAMGLKRWRIIRSIFSCRLESEGRPSSAKP